MENKIRFRNHISVILEQLGATFGILFVLFFTICSLCYTFYCAPYSIYTIHIISATFSFEKGRIEPNIIITPIFF
jgi:hypothetical protein